MCWFLSFLSYLIKENESPELRVKFGRETLDIYSWSSKQQYDSLCQVYRNYFGDKFFLQTPPKLALPRNFPHLIFWNPRFPRKKLTSSIPNKVTS